MRCVEIKRGLRAPPFPADPYERIARTRAGREPPRLRPFVKLREKTGRRPFTRRHVQAAGGKKNRDKTEKYDKKETGVFAADCGNFFLVLGFLAARESGAQTHLRKMNITGKIAEARHGYIIRGKVPAEVFTILNPAPDKFNAFVKSEKTVSLEARVSGDSVEIETIDARDYP